LVVEIHVQQDKGKTFRFQTGKGLRHTSFFYNKVSLIAYKMQYCFNRGIAEAVVLTNLRIKVVLVKTLKGVK